MSNTVDDPRFTTVSSGRFRDRFGPLGRSGGYSSKKLCLVSTDLGFLQDFLYALAQREDCYYVKFGTVSREGMVLGRAFFRTDQAAAELCQELKGHPRLMASLQDDAWFEQFREEPIPSGSCGVWDDWEEHWAEVRQVHEAAFGRPDEAEIVAALRKAGAATVSLAAQLPPEPPGKGAWSVVGHVVLSPVDLDGSREPLGLGLGPLAVMPAQQRKGFGARLVETAIRRARILGYRYLVVLGHPEYYPRFGFAPASQFGLSYAEGGIPDDAFMALELVPGALTGRAGAVRYHPAFSS